MKKIGKYDVVEKVGSGAMGTVYKAFDPLLERTVAIKMMSTDFDADPELRTRFFREARSAGQLSHQNIVTIFDLGEEGGRPYIAMEFLDGEDLKERIDRQEAMTLERKLRLMLEVCRGLAHAHHNEIVHRDVKPSNIRFTSAGKCKILDFGLARIASSEITRTGMVMGTPSYMSPEQVGGKKADHRSDIFSAGAVFYELLTFEKPFTADTLPATFMKILQDNPTPPHEVDAAIPEAMTTILTKALAKDPDDRYENIDEMTEELEEFRSSLNQKKKALLEEATKAVDRFHEVREANEALFEQVAAAVETTDPLLQRSPAGDAEIEEALGRTIPGFPADYLGLIAIRDKAEGERARLEGILENLEWAAPLIEEAKEFEASGDFEKCLEIVERVLAKLPDHEAAEILKGKITEALEAREAEQKRARELAELMSRARELVDAGDLEPGLAEIKKVLKLEPEHADAQALRKTTEEALEQLKQKAKKAKQAQTAMAAARKALVSEEVKVARQQAERAMELDPDVTGAPELLTEVAHLEQEVADRKERDAKVKALLNEARALQESGEEDEALERLAEVMELNPEEKAALKLKDKIEKRRKAEQKAERERRVKVAIALERADEARQAGNFKKALRLAESAVKEDPEHTEAMELVDALKEELDSSENRQRKLKHLMQQARVLDEQAEEEEALARLEEVLALDPDHQEARSLKEQIERQMAQAEVPSHEAPPRVPGDDDEAPTRVIGGAIEETVEVEREAAAGADATAEAEALDPTDATVQAEAPFRAAEEETIVASPEPAAEQATLVDARAIKRSKAEIAAAEVEEAAIWRRPWFMAAGAGFVLLLIVVGVMRLGGGGPAPATEDPGGDTAKPIEGPLAPVPSSSWRLPIEWDSSGAVIWVDGMNSGVTAPATIELEGEEGERVLVELRRGNATLTQTWVTLGPSVPARWPEPVRYTIASDPEDAIVFANGDRVTDATPINLELLPGQRYTLRLEKEGYVSETKSFTLADLDAEERRSRRLDFSMREEPPPPPTTPPAVTFTVSSDPPGARLFLNGQPVEGTTPVEIRLRPDERHVVRLELDGYEAIDRTFTFDDLDAAQRDSRQLQFPLTALPVVFLVTSEPEGATVTIDGQRLADPTPVTVDLSRDRRHEVQLSLEGHETVIRPFTIDELTPAERRFSTINFVLAEEAPDEAVQDVVVPAQVIERVEPTYPRRALSQRLIGVVVVSATIDPQGNVGEVRIIREFMPALGFNDAAVDAVRQWKFQPATRNGEPIEWVATIRINFNPPGS